MKYNFCSGPSILPQEVFQQAAAAVIELGGIGLSLLEISHRSDEFTAIIEEATDLISELLNVPDTHAVLFLQGGASTQFGMVPMNLMREGGKAGYVNTGVWTEKAVEDAEKFGEVVEVASSRDDHYCYIPSGFDIPEGLDYLHIATNNTIYGTEWHAVPDSPCPLVADMSSNLFSREIDVSKYGLIYAGAQKNLGPAGVTLVIIDRKLLGQSGRIIPNMLDYRIHVRKKSVYNTPPVFAIYVCLLTLRWLKAQGGVEAIETVNIEKARRLYAEIDRNPLLYGTVDPGHRSRMNVTFRLHDESMEEKLFGFFDDRDIVNINGHRLVGGFRASIYNAMPLEGVDYLIKALREFEQSNG